ncbi:class I SAM-dependent methyltransferase [Chelatococcus reniformis]|uniref:S-adenosyl-L-methionine methyltransferase n=1 Tax=Chelatococcus reniformis TaxID=1494448 RepID=A0A916TWD5_9HYPH|nr:class I SAM-dependent methyltransferase [Chelatococcus reniformis]GGC46454.1 hypothetical protein GCM10010994_01990 [Chelatococcus reniformis]
MSRLDSFIRRLLAQRACLDRAAVLVGGVPGPVVELGLGNGRTYDHLRQILPERRIYVFERAPAAHPLCTPAAGYLVVGDFAETLPGAVTRLGGPAALIHADVGSGDETANARLAAWLGPLIVPMLAEGGIITSDQRLTAEGLAPQPVPAEADKGRYYLYRRTAMARRAAAS